MPSWVYDLESFQILDVNQAAIEQYGYSKQELLGLTFKYFSSEIGAVDFVAAHKEINAKKGNHFFGTFTHKKKSGELIRTNLNGHIIHYSGRKCVLATGQNQLIQQDMGSLFHASREVVISIDENGNFVPVSDGSVVIWGYSQEELEGKAYLDLVYPDDIEKVKQVIAELKSGNSLTDLEIRYIQKDGEIVFNLCSAFRHLASKLIFIVVKDPTVHWKTDSLLVESENRFRSLVQEGLDLIAILGSDGNYRYVSPTSFNVLGMKPDEFVGKSPLEFIHPDDVARILDSLQKIAELPRMKLEPFRFKNNKQEWRWIETILTNMLDNPAVNGIVANSRDITETVNLLKDRKVQDQFNRTIIESSPDCLKILDKDGQLLYMNFNGLCQMEIDDFSEFKYKKWWQLWGSENEELVKNSIESALKGEIVQFSALCPTAKGTSKWWDVTVSPVFEADDSIQKIISVSRDITAKKEEEQRLKLMESVITNTHDAVMITEAEPINESGPRILYVNEAFTKMTGYTAVEVIGKTPRLLQGPNSDRTELARLKKALQNWESCEITTINYKKSGEEFWINLSVSPVANENGWFTHFISVERDVTEQKQKELEKELLNKISLDFSFENDLTVATNRVCSTLSAFGKFDLVEIWTVNIENTQLQLFANHVRDRDDEQFYQLDEIITSLLPSEGLPGKVWATQAQLLWGDIDTHTDFIRKNAARKIGLKAVMGIPIICNTSVVGVLVIGTKQDAVYLKKFSKIFQQVEGYLGSEINRKRLENDLSHLYEAMPDILGLADFKGRFLKMNKAGCELLGYREEEVIFHSFDEFVHPKDKEIFTNELVRLEKGQISSKFEIRCLAKNGDIIWLSWTCNSSLQEGLIYVTAKNITEENKLRELKRQTNKLAKIGSWEIDLIREKLYWSDMVHELHDTDPTAFVPELRSAINFYREDFRQNVQSDIRNCISTGKPFDFEAVLVTNRKKERWVRAIGNAEFVDGECKRIYGSFQDIHERKEAEIRLQSLADNLPGVVFQYFLYPDGSESLKNVSKGAEQIWGFSPEAVSDNFLLVWNQIKAGGNYDEVQESILATIQSRSKLSTKFKYVLPNGDVRYHLAYGSPNFLADGTVFFNSVILDITQDAKNEELLGQATELAKIGSWELNLINQEGGSLYWSPMTKHIFEVDMLYNPSLTVGFEFYTDESRMRIEKALDNLVNEGKEFDLELLVITAAGNEKWVRCIGKSDRVKDAYIRVYGSFQDIHASKSLEIKIREILGSISDAFYAVDADWRFTYFNKEAERLLMKSEAEVLGKNMWDIFPAAKETQMESYYKEALETNEPRSFEFLFPADNCWYEINAYPSKGGLSVYFKNIDERKKAAARLERAYNEKNNILESIGDAFFSVNKDWIVTYWNKEAEKLLGRKREVIIGRNLWEEYADAIESDFYTQYHKAMETQRNITFEEYYPTLGKWFEVSAYPSKKSLSVYFKDVTLRKEADIRLVNVNKEKTRILERITEAFVSLDANWCYTYMNKQAGEIFNRDPEKMIGKHIWTEFPEGLGQPFHHAYEKAMATQEYIYMEEHYKPFNKWFENHIYPSPDGLSIFFRDITEKKRAEQEILRANERFEKVAEATNDAIWEWDISNDVHYWGGGFKSLFGHDVDKIFPTGQVWKAHIHPEDLAEVQNSLFQVINSANQDVWKMEYRYLRKDGTFAFVIDKGIVVRNEQGKAIRMVGAMTDISSQKKHERELLELNESLKKYSRQLELTNEELEQFAFIASHDLQEPLRMISSFLDQLKRKYSNNLDEKANQYIYYATDGAKRMKQIILDLLEYSRAGKLTHSTELVDLNEVVEQYTLLRRKIISERNVVINFGKLPSVESYKSPLTQTLHCLLDNAIKYVRQDQTPLVTITMEELNDSWLIQITDNGIGIESEFFEKIFIIFQRLHNRDVYAGTGIGLSIAKKHVESWGGKIWLESESGKGSTFYFTHPKDLVI